MVKGPPAGWVDRRLLIFVAAVTAVRAVFAAVVPLTEDEAYYRLWAQTLQAGYFDHPPMIAWWIWAGTHLAGHTALGVRLAPVLAAGVTSLLVADIARQLGGDRLTALRAAVWYNATLTIGLGGLLATPDAAVALFWAGVVAVLARLRGDGRPVTWLAAGAIAGAACLSKYSGLFIAPGVLLWLWRRPGGLRILRRPAPWLAVVAAVLVFLPNVIWNAGHDWVTFHKQFGRVAPSRFAPSHLPEFIVAQVFLLNPLIAAFAAIGVRRWWRTRDAEGVGLAVLVGAPFAGYLAIHALHDAIQAHWPAPLYASLAVIAAFAAQDATGGWQAVRRLAGPLGLGLASLGLLHAALPATDVFTVFDPALPLRAWPEFADAVDGLRRQENAAWIGTVSYGTAAQLDWLLPARTPVVQLSERARYPAADRSWTADLSRPGLVVDLARRMDPNDLKLCFAEVQPIADLDRGHRLGPAVRYAAYRVARPRPDILGQGCWRSKSLSDDRAR